jgi:predicted nucleic acid-binding protein
MPAGKHYYWDSCVFISLLTLKDRTAEEIEDLRALEVLSDDGQITIFTSAITLIEVLECYLTPEQEKIFQLLLKRSTIEVVSVVSRIAMIAREIRNHYASKALQIAVPDSIHLATAIHYKASGFHTYDGCGRRPKHTDLLKLEMPIVGKYELRISRPSPPPRDESPAIENVQWLAGSLFEQLDGESHEGEK